MQLRASSVSDVGRRPAATDESDLKKQIAGAKHPVREPQETLSKAHSQTVNSNSRSPLVLDDSLVDIETMGLGER
jgi:hypothetical protein